MVIGSRSHPPRLRGLLVNDAIVEKIGRFPKPFLAPLHCKCMWHGPHALFS